jgi:hypothetical protein
MDGMKNVVMFSGGIGSWAAARRVVDRNGPKGTVLLFADTRIEDPDLYRFLDEAAENIGVGITRLVEGRTPWEVFRDVRFLGNTRIDPCSRVLKREPMRRWLEENCDPADTVVTLGFDWTEVHRLDRARPFWAPWTVAAPLCDPPYRDKQALMSDLRDAGIEPPRLYDLGFPHNNCGGGCVKAGVSHFALLHDRLPEVYAEWERHEQELRSELGNVAILRDRRDHQTKPLTLSDLRRRIESGQLIPAGDFGGCACLEPPGEGA